MAQAETYRQKALELCARAQEQTEIVLRAEYESLAFLYLDLAEQVDRQFRWDEEAA